MELRRTATGRGGSLHPSLAPNPRAPRREVQLLDGKHRPPDRPWGPDPAFSLPPRLGSQADIPAQQPLCFLLRAARCRQSADFLPRGLTALEKRGHGDPGEP